MKTTTNRIRTNGATKYAAEQDQTIEVKSKFGPEFDLPKNTKHHACLALFDRNDQELVGKIPLDEDEFARLLDLASLTASSIQPQLPEKLSKIFSTRNIIAGWIRHALRIDSIVNEFESAKAQSHALHLLLLDAMQSKKDATYGEEIQFGIIELIISTHKRMNGIYDAISKTAPGVAA